MVGWETEGRGWMGSTAPKDGSEIMAERKKEGRGADKIKMQHYTNIRFNSFFYYPDMNMEERS